MQNDNEGLDKLWHFFKENAKAKRFPLDSGIHEFCEANGIDYYREYDDIEQVFIDNEVLLRTWAGLARGPRFNSFEGFNKEKNSQAQKRLKKEEPANFGMKLKQDWWIWVLFLTLGFILGRMGF
jgi:hypothetical protein